MPGNNGPQPHISTFRAHPARVWNYLLGGSLWNPADQEAAESIKCRFPAAEICAQENQAFHQRAVETALRTYGVRQFLDIGTGLPSEPIFQVVQAEAPGCRIVCTDPDPVVVEERQRLLSHSPPRDVAVHRCAVTDTSPFSHAGVRKALDLRHPVAVSMVSLLHGPPADSPAGFVQGVVEQLCPGSLLILSCLTADLAPGAEEAACELRLLGAPAPVRTRPEVTRLFEGTALMAPGVAPSDHWRAGSGRPRSTRLSTAWAGVGRIT